MAQTFDPDLMEQMGRLVGEEMEQFHITLWLAPGMNIHRNPLCGRNFEYYSEDPCLTGKMAAAITRGVQSCPGVGTTIKHFVCNNQEDNRQHRDSVVSERALREIYLKGFEIAVKESAPLAVMSPYNLLNGVHTANSYDLLTNVLRREWGFQGMVMTDWNTTGKGGSAADLCIRAGNDLVMQSAVSGAAGLRGQDCADDLTVESVRGRKTGVKQKTERIRKLCAKVLDFPGFFPYHKKKLKAVTKRSKHRRRPRENGPPAARPFAKRCAQGSFRADGPGSFEKCRCPHSLV